MNRTLIALAVLLTLMVGTASAQTVRNPTKAVVTVSADHADVTKYELGWFLGAAVDPVQVADIGTGVPVAGELEKPLPSYPVGVTYTAKVKAYAGAVASDWSPASNPFFRSPATPGLLVIR